MLKWYLLLFLVSMYIESANNAHLLPHRHFSLIVNSRDQIDFKLKITDTNLIVTKMWESNWMWPQNFIFFKKLFAPLGGPQ